jgi:hypothetical protein
MNKIAIDIDIVDLVLRGMPGSPLVVHNFSDKAREEIRQKQLKKGKKAKEARNPEAEFEASKYIDGQGRECVPITVIKKSFINAATAMDDLTKVALRQALFASPSIDQAASLIPIENHRGEFIKGTMREDAVTIGIATRGLAYRPEYPEWQLRVRVQFNPRLISLDQLLMLVGFAGWGVGICEGRPEKSSALGWGRYECSSYEAVKISAPGTATKKPKKGGEEAEPESEAAQA